MTFRIRHLKMDRGSKTKSRRFFYNIMIILDCEYYGLLLYLTLFSYFIKDSIN